MDKITNSEISNVVEIKGLQYALNTFYYGDIEDEKMARAWKAAQDAVDDLQDLIDKIE